MKKETKLKAAALSRSVRHYMPTACYVVAVLPLVKFALLVLLGGVDYMVAHRGDIVFLFLWVVGVSLIGGLLDTVRVVAETKEKVAARKEEY